MCSSLNSGTSSTAIVLLHLGLLCCMTCSEINRPPLPPLLYLPTAPSCFCAARTCTVLGRTLSPGSLALQSNLSCFSTVTSKPSRSRVPRTSCAILCYPSQAGSYRGCQEETQPLSYVTLPYHWSHLSGVLVICSVPIWPSTSSFNSSKEPHTAGLAVPCSWSWALLAQAGLGTRGTGAGC